MTTYDDMLKDRDGAGVQTPIGVLYATESQDGEDFPGINIYLKRPMDERPVLVAIIEYNGADNEKKGLQAHLYPKVDDLDAEPETTCFMGEGL